ncbi:MAG: hypothetical protein EPO52_12400 [Herbiconiux sp.]|uniref:hypothetical protein n=1 Tax=Herbiconiux sp. TaxID=1871186 RepID=UPI00120EC977|nr:hypothetical protein [Herbiconiux sp.]TAJ47296.1 MAG: hypothetical protein EPO52_12400 [Herbiconiux sp.]
MTTEPKSTAPGAALVAVGVILLLIGIIWMAIIGFYPSQLPIILVLLVAGGVLSWAGQRMYQSAKRANAEHRIAQRDDEAI